MNWASDEEIAAFTLKHSTLVTQLEQRTDEIQNLKTSGHCPHSRTYLVSSMFGLWNFSQMPIVENENQKRDSLAEKDKKLDESSNTIQQLQRSLVSWFCLNTINMYTGSGWTKTILIKSWRAERKHQIHIFVAHEHLYTRVRYGCQICATMAKEEGGLCFIIYFYFSALWWKGFY